MDNSDNSLVTVFSVVSNESSTIDHRRHLLSSAPPIKTMESKKRILCQHYIRNLLTPTNKNFCSYGPKCIYAHGLEKQVIDPIKVQCLEILLDGKYSIINDSETYDCDIHKDDEIKYFTQHYYKELLSFVDICENCIELEKIRLHVSGKITLSDENIKRELDKCIGGLNCKHGSPFTETKICKEQFFNGGCSKEIREIPIIDPELLNFKKTDFVPRGCSNGQHLDIEPYHVYLKRIENQKLSNTRLIIDVKETNDNPYYDVELDEIIKDYKKTSVIYSNEAFYSDGNLF